MNPPQQSPSKAGYQRRGAISINTPHGTQPTSSSSQPHQQHHQQQHPTSHGKPTNTNIFTPTNRSNSITSNTSSNTAVTNNTTTTNNNNNTVSSSSSKSAEAEHKTRKENFLMFTRVLMKYLEQKDKAMHSRAKAVIRECAEKNKQKDPNYSSLSASMQSRLKQLVGQHYWKKAEEYLSQFLKGQYLKKQHRPGGGPGGSAGAAGAGSTNRPMTVEEARKQAQKLAQTAAAPLPAATDGVGIISPSNSKNVHRTTVAATTSSYPTHGQPTHAQKQQQQRQRQLSAQRTSNPQQQQKLTQQQLLQQQQQQQQQQLVGKQPNKRQKSSGNTTGGKKKTIITSSAVPSPLPSDAATNKLLQQRALVGTTSTAAGAGTTTPTMVNTKKVTVVGGTNNRSSKGGGKAGVSPISGRGGNTNATSKKNQKVTVAGNLSSQQQLQQQHALQHVQQVQAPPPIKEYEEWMDMVDHMTDYDVKSSALILNNSESKKAGVLNLSEEQRKLLSCGDVAGMPSSRGIFNGSSRDNIPSSTTLQPKQQQQQQQPQQQHSRIPAHLRGMNNIITPSEIATRLQLLKREEENKNSQWTLPGVNIAKKEPDIIHSSSSKSMGIHNSDIDMEDVEDEEALALLSEATQIYVKTLLEGALNVARKRMNLDGIRLWHQQHTGATKTSTSSSTTTTMNGSSTQSTPTYSSLSAACEKKNPLYLRLGCDVYRQFSLAEGNAAKTCQRMEEALARQPEEDRLGHKRKFQEVDDNDGHIDMNTIMYEASSMADVAKYPKLPNASVKAEYDAGRYFEVYGGKESGKPPLGRVPNEVAYITTHDLKLCLQDPAFSLYRKGIAAPSFV